MNPHVSDEQIEEAAFARVPTPKGLDPADDDDNEVIEGHKADRYWISYGMKECRDLYEPLVTSQAERIAALEAVLEAILEEYDDDLVMVHTPIAYFKKFGAARALLTPKTTDPK